MITCLEKQTFYENMLKNQESTAHLKKITKLILIGFKSGFIYKVDFPAQQINNIQTKSSFLDTLIYRFASVKTPQKSTLGKIVFGQLKKYTYLEI